jgi:protein arginine kinase activator
MSNEPHCLKCNKPATHKITKIIKGKVHDFFLCDEHAREFSPYLKAKKIDQSKLVEILQHFLKQQEHMLSAGKGPNPRPDGPVCSNCGLHFSAYKKTFLLGCSDCYTSFEDLLLDDLRKIHGATCQDPEKEPFLKRESAAPVPPEVEPVRLDIELNLEVAQKPVVEEASPQIQIENARQALEAAVRNEDFQLAARLRDKIRALEQKASDDV